MEPNKVKYGCIVKKLYHSSDTHLWRCPIIAIRYFIHIVFSVGIWVGLLIVLVVAEVWCRLFAIPVPSSNFVLLLSPFPKIAFIKPSF